MREGVNRLVVCIPNEQMSRAGTKTNLGAGLAFFLEFFFGLRRDSSTTVSAHF